MGIKRIRKSLLLAAVSCGILLAALPSAQAALITVDFVATNFSPDHSGYPPADTVSGTIVYEAASPSAAIDSLVSIDLTIAGYSYGLGEICYALGSPWESELLWIGGLNHDMPWDFSVTWLQSRSNDFRFSWNPISLTPSEFRYVTPTAIEDWDTSTFTRFSVTENVVTPEPSTVLLLGAGLAGLIGYGRWRMKQRPSD